MKSPESLTARISYSIPQAADATGCSEKQVRRAITAGALPAVRQPYPDGTPNERGKFLILHRDLMAWVSEMPAA